MSKPTFTLNAYNNAAGSTAIVVPQDGLLVQAVICGVDLNQLSNSAALESAAGQQSANLICQMASGSATQPLSARFNLQIPLKSGQRLYFNSATAGSVSLIYNAS